MGTGISWRLFRFSMLEQSSKKPKAGVTRGKGKPDSEEGQIDIVLWKAAGLWRKPARNHLHPV